MAGIMPKLRLLIAITTNITDKPPNDFHLLDLGYRNVYKNMAGPGYP